MTSSDPYMDQGVPASNDAKISRWLLVLYFTLPFWGILWLYLFWNGSWGWFDRGAWNQLQQAANTTFPTLDLTDPSLRQESRNRGFYRMANAHKI